MPSEKSYLSRKSGIGSVCLTFLLRSVTIALSILQVVSQNYYYYFAHLLDCILKGVFTIVKTFRAGFGKFIW